MSTQMSVTLPPDIALPAGSINLRGAALLTLVTILAILIGYFQTIWSMVLIWQRSETFAHCFLIVPISAWMIWEKRKELIQVDHKPNPLALIVLGGLGFGWLLAALANVSVFQQYFLVAMIPITVWSILGSRIAWAIAFPLGYLLLAVPFGEILIPTLINVTADFTVTAVQLTGIPIYREGNFFTLPSGNWSVVEACSGLRYLIASLTLGILFAYLTYRSTKRRLIFIAFAVIVPIVANGLRAFMIVMIGHVSGMTLAVGVDHLVYGWLFFGLVMLLLFWVGSIWREDNRDRVATKTQGSTKQLGSASIKGTAGAAIITIAVAFIWPAYAAYLDRGAAVAEGAKIQVPGTPGKWDAVSSVISDWKPGYVGTPLQFQQTYQNGERTVSLHIAKYQHQRSGSQLITSGNLLVQNSARDWNNVSETSRSITLGSSQLTVTQNRLLSPSTKLLVWRWYRLVGEETNSPYRAKIILAKHKLLAGADDGAQIIIAASYQDKPEEAVTVLQSFLDDMMPAISKGVGDASGR